MAIFENLSVNMPIAIEETSGKCYIFVNVINLLAQKYKKKSIRSSI